MSADAILRRALEPFARAARPLSRAARRRVGLYEHLALLGWELDHLRAVDLAGLQQALDASEAAFAQVVAALDPHASDQDVADAALASARAALASLDAVRDALLADSPGEDDAMAAMALGEDLASDLLARHLAQEWPLLNQLAVAFGVVARERATEIVVDDGGVRVVLRHPVMRSVFRLDALRAAVLDPAGAALAKARGDASVDGGLAGYAGRLEDSLDALALFAGELGSATFRLGPGRIEVDGLDIPLQPGSSVSFEVPLAADLRPRVRVEPARVVVEWGLAPGQGAEDLVLFDEGGLQVSLAEAGGHVSGVVLSRLVEAPTLEVTVGLAVALPVDVLAEEQGGAVRAAGVATLRVARDEHAPVLTVHEARVEARDVRVGGVGGLPVVGARVVLRDLVLPRAQGARLGIEVEGVLALPEVEAGVRAVLDAQGFLLEATGRARLGDLALEPVAPDPVLRIRAPGGDAFALDLAGRVTLPLAGAARSLDLRGALSLARQGGAVRVVALSASASSRLDLPLAQGLTLRSAAASLAWDEAARRVSLGLAGEVSLAQGRVAASLDVALHHDASGAPTHATFLGTAAAWDVPLAELGLLARGRLSLAGSTAPGAPAEGRLDDGRVLLFPRAQPGPADDAESRHHLVARDVAATLAFSPRGVVLDIASAQVDLPRVFDRPDGERPSVSFQGLTLSWLDGAPDARGTLTLRDAGLGTPEGFEAVLEEGSIILAGAAAPTLRLARGHVRIPLPEGVFEPAPGEAELALVVDARDAEWTLDGLPSRGALALRETVTLALGEGFDLAFLGAEDPDALVGTGIAFDLVDGRLALTLDAAVRIGFPVGLAETDETPDGRVWGLGEASLVLGGAPGARPRLAIRQVAMGARALHLGRGGSGGSGLLIEDARVAILHPDALVDPASPDPFTVQLSGLVKTAPSGASDAAATQLAFDLQEATFRFPPHAPPTFTFSRVGVAADPPPTLAGLPLVVRAAWIETKERRDDMPLAELLHPMNLRLGVSMGLVVSGGSTAASAGVRDLTVSLDARGRPQVALDGFTLGVDGLVVGNLTLSGAVTLQGFLTGDLLFAGKVGGTWQGTGLKLLVAFRLAPGPVGSLPVLMPLGMCLDVAGGTAGIPLGATGILVVGAAGGVSFANTNGSPCDFKTYAGLDDEGRRVPPGETPSPEPEGTDGPGPSTLRPGRAGDCPQPCPPPSLNILCQRHPDPALRRSRAIVKFTSLDRDFLVAIGLKDAIDGTFAAFPADLTPDRVRPYAHRVAEEFVRGFAEHELVVALLVGVPESALPADLDPEVRAWLVSPRQKAAAEFHRLVREAIEKELGSLTGKTPFDVVAEVLRRGFPCPDVSLLVTGSVSYAGISSVASVTGGASVSTAGSVGVFGMLNVVGIPVGELRGFVTATDDEGNFSPSLCGDLRFSVGPLDLGQVGVTERFLQPGGSLEGALLSAASRLPAGALVGCLAEALGRAGIDPSEDPRALLLSLDREQVSRFFLALGERAARAAVDPATTLALAEALRDLAVGLIQAYEPRIDCCGLVQPRLFGIPLTPQPLAAARAWGTPAFLGAEVAFSPSYLLGTVLPFAGAFTGMDAAAVGFSLAAPDPRELAVDVLAGRLLSPQDLDRFVRRGADRLLDEASYTVAYAFSPFGLDLAEAGGRVVLPRLLRHPALGHPWENPDTRRDARGVPYPSRMEALDAALRAGSNPGGRLTDTAWTGALDEMAVEGRAPLQGLSLADDYFPHGGIVGAAYLEVPLALLDAPDLALLGRIAGASAPGADWKEEALRRSLAAFEYIQKYVLATRRVGTFAFYVPAPNPPSAARALQDRADVLDEILRAGQDLPGSLAATYPADLAFLRGTLEGTLLGVPVGRARVEALPAGPEGRAEAELLIEAEVPEGSWLRDAVESATLRARVLQPPAVPVQARFRALAAALGLDPGTLDAVRADAEAEAARVLDAVRPPLVATLDPERRFAHEELRARLGMDRLAPLRGVLDAAATLLARAAEATAAGDAEAAARVREDLARVALDALAQDLPRVELEASLRGFDLDGLTGGLLEDLDADGSATLVAFSPRFDPDSPLAGAEGDARRHGGVVLRVDAALRLGGHRVELRDAQLALAFPSVDDLAERLATPPALRLSRGWDRLRIPGTGIELRDARLALTTAPAPGEPFVRISGSVDGLRAGRLALAPLAPGARLGASVEIWPDAQGRPADVRVRVDPARLVLPLLASDTTLRVHGEGGPGEPLTLSLGDAWSAAASFERIDLVSPYDPDDPAFLSLRPDGALQASLSGDGLGAWCLRVEAPSSAVALFPHAPHLPHAMAGVRGGALVVEAASDAHPSLSFDIPPLMVDAVRVHGAPRAGEPVEAAWERPVRARLTPYGLTLADAHLSVAGLTRKPLALRSFVIDGFGRFSVTSRATRVDCGLFAFSTRGVRFARTAAGWSLELLAPRLRALEKTPYARRAGLDLGMPSLALSTEGAFHLRFGPVALSAGALLALRGTLEAGNAPGAGAFLRLLDVEVDAGALGTYGGVARVELTRERARADLGGETLHVAGLAHVEIGGWTLEHEYPSRLSIRASGASARLLDSASVRLDEVEVVASPGGRALTARSDGGVVLVPGVLEVGSGRLRLETSGEDGTLAFRGEARAFRTPDGWLLRAADAATFSRADGRVAGVVRPRVLQGLAELPGILAVGAGTSTAFAWSPSSALRVTGLSAAFLGHALALAGEVDGTGAVTAKARPTLSFGAFTLALEGDLAVTLQPRVDQPPGVAFPAARLRSTLPGWPREGVPLSGVSLDGGAFGADLAPFAWHGIGLTRDEAGETLRAVRDGSGFRAVLRSMRSFFGAGLEIDATLRADGTVVAAARGTLDVTLGDARWDFGAVEMRYRPDHADYPFSVDVAQPARFRLSFGRRGARACTLRSELRDGEWVDVEGSCWTSPG